MLSCCWEGNKVHLYSWQCKKQLANSLITVPTSYQFTWPRKIHKASFFFQPLLSVLSARLWEVEYSSIWAKVRKTTVMQRAGLWPPSSGRSSPSSGSCWVLLQMWPPDLFNDTLVQTESNRMRVEQDKQDSARKQLVLCSSTLGQSLKLGLSTFTWVDFNGVLDFWRGRHQSIQL